MSVSEKVLGAESHWLMGRVMPRDLLEGIGRHLHHFAPDREPELVAAIRARAHELCARSTSTSCRRSTPRSAGCVPSAPR